MSLPLYTTLTISCEASEEQTGPTLVHSTGVENYRIHPEVIRILQESCSNQKLCDHEKGVQCTDPPEHIVDAFKRAGFTVTTSTKADNRKLWILTKTGQAGDNSNQPTNPPDNNDEEEEEENLED